MSESPVPVIDFWIILDLLAHRWRWLALGAVLCGLAALAVAAKLVGPKFTASAQLLRYGTPGASDFFKQDAPMSSETFAGPIRAPDLLRRVGEKAAPPIPPEILARQIKVDPDGESDLVNVVLAARTRQDAVTLLNIYLTNAAQFLREIQSEQIRLAADNYLGKQVGQMDQDISDLDKELRALAVAPQITNKVTQIGGQLHELGRSLAGPPRPSAVLALETDRLNQALGELTGLLSKYTEIHPLVRQKQAEVQALKAQVAADSTNTVATPAEAAMPAALAAQPPAPALNPEVDIIRAKLLSLEEGRVQLVNRQREAQLYVANPPATARVFAPATLQTVRSNMRGLKVAIATGWRLH